MTSFKQNIAIFCALFLIQTCVAKSTSRKARVEIGGEEFTFGTDAIGWFDAETACEGQGMRLATLDTEARYTLITDFISQNPDYDVQLWTSGHRDANGAIWHWESTHEDFTFTAWVSGYPQQPTAVESCMFFSVTEGGWKDADCGTATAGYLCESIPAQI